jgi:hypothetical protein
VEVTVGKHTAPDDSTVHPLVADALARRTGAAPTAHGAAAPGRSGSTGWPEPPPSGGGAVGWPGELRHEGGAQDAVADPMGAPGADQRRGWRRLFGAA